MIEWTLNWSLCKLSLSTVAGRFKFAEFSKNNPNNQDTSKIYSKILTKLSHLN